VLFYDQQRRPLVLEVVSGATGPTGREKERVVKKGKDNVKEKEKEKEKKETLPLSFTLIDGRGPFASMLDSLKRKWTVQFLNGNDAFRYLCTARQVYKG
jgi:hypothetical protein